MARKKVRTRFYFGKKSHGKEKGKSPILLKHVKQKVRIQFKTNNQTW